MLGAGDARFFAKRKRETDDGADWKWLLWESDVARAKIHPELGAGWTAVLKEACCVRAAEGPKRKKRKEDVGRDRCEAKSREASPLRLNLADLLEKDDFVVTVPMLRWCFKRGYRLERRIVEATARGGDLEAVKWLRMAVGRWEDQSVAANACAGAAEGGHVDVLKWLREEGCPWDGWQIGETSRRAARGGHLDVLKYAREHGCPWDWGATFMVARMLPSDAGESVREWMKINKLACELG